MLSFSSPLALQRIQHAGIAVDMMIDIHNGRSIDTEKDLGPEERHIVQKFMAWASTVTSVARFRELRKKALADGWNNSGPVRESRALSLIAIELEAQIRKRLQNGP
jgi:hypothetical protein